MKSCSSTLIIFVTLNECPTSLSLSFFICNGIDNSIKLAGQSLCSAYLAQCRVQRRHSANGNIEIVINNNIINQGVRPAAWKDPRRIFKWHIKLHPCHSMF